MKPSDFSEGPTFVHDVDIEWSEYDHYPQECCLKDSVSRSN